MSQEAEVLIRRPMVGIYRARWSEQEGQPARALSMTVNQFGKLAATLFLGAARYNFTGRLDASDVFKATIPLRDGTVARLQRAMKATRARRFTGTLRTGGGSSSFTTQ